MKRHIPGQPVYHSTTLSSWQSGWMKASGCSSEAWLDLMAWHMTQPVLQWLAQQPDNQRDVLIWCGSGACGQLGLRIARRLVDAAQAISQIAVYATAMLPDQYGMDGVMLLQSPDQAVLDGFALHLDALQAAPDLMPDSATCNRIEQLNRTTGFKIALHHPSGLDPDRGLTAAPVVKADWTLCALGLQLGLLTGQGRYFAGQVRVLAIIPPSGVADTAPTPLAYLDTQVPLLPPRQDFQHKGDFGHVAVVGGHPHMGGAVIMAAEAALAAGAGKVTVICAPCHHTAILSRCPAVMVQDIADWLDADAKWQQFDSICFGMGLGRDALAQQHWQAIWPHLQQQTQTIVLDADALYWLAQTTIDPAHLILRNNMYATPHTGEAATLLHCPAAQIEADRLAALHELQHQYGGQWLLKGAGSLTLEQGQVHICPFGNPGMGTAGMGDTLSGLLAALKGQFGDQVTLAQAVALHARAGDWLAQDGQRGLLAHMMPAAIRRIVNGKFDFEDSHLSEKWTFTTHF